MSTNNQDCSNNLYGVAVFIVTLACYLSINEEIAIECHVTEQRAYLFHMWTMTLIIILSHIFVSCYIPPFSIENRSRKEMINRIHVSLGIIQIIAFWIIIIILWKDDHYVYKYKLHDCFKSNSTSPLSPPPVVVITQVISMISNVIALLTMSLGAVLVITAGCLSRIYYISKSRLDSKSNNEMSNTCNNV